MSKILLPIIALASCAFSLSISYSAHAAIKTSGGFPQVPHAGIPLRVNDLIKDARVETLETDVVGGYKVTDPNGNTFFVDNIENPKCALYTNVVTVNEGAFINPDLQIQQNVNIDRVDFSSCF